mmetsp:Transcript_19916/g.48336  ORF Transcript_19916/g.48336 Transcript_19916/m.48336 type:complete len:130 (+) Transcript_19916:138-527(+)
MLLMKMSHKMQRDRAAKLAAKAAATAAAGSAAGSAASDSGPGAEGAGEHGDGGEEDVFDLEGEVTKAYSKFLEENPDSQAAFNYLWGEDSEPPAWRFLLLIGVFGVMTALLVYAVWHTYQDRHGGSGSQ